MSRALTWLLLVATLAGCSTRSVVVKPEEAARLNDQQWTVKSPPRPR